eukprot:TRINITY_DN4949_c0_g1_i1.p1 TRINITY_DN4949_c0_g1~~TRINITY_DN4949_c0_g1_i1.p1  ORF type:complete len:1378 (+),score=600.42 TRINITY_DN4949_c0_g1_i1:89-4135(+)
MAAPAGSLHAARTVSPRRHGTPEAAAAAPGPGYAGQPSRALEVALARAAAHRQAAQKKAREHSSAIAQAQSAIGEELAELRQEVLRVRRETVGLNPNSPTTRATETPPQAGPRLPRQTPPTHPASMRPSESGGLMGAAQAWDDVEKPAGTPPPPQAAAAAAATPGRGKAEEEELQRLRKIELQHTAKCAANRDLEHRLATFEAELREASASHTCASASLAELSAAFLQSLRQRLPQVAEFHRHAKAMLAETGWTKVHSMSTTAEIKSDADAAIRDLTEDSSGAALIHARDKLREYETYALQMHATARKLIDERLVQAKSQAATYEAKLAGAEARVQQAEAEIERVRSHADSQLSRSRDELMHELRNVKGGFEAQYAERQASLREGLAKEREALAHGYERQKLEAEAQLEQNERELARVRRELDDMKSQLLRQQALHERDVEAAAEAKLQVWVRERQAAEADAERARNAYLANLEAARERAEDKVRALIEEVEFKEASQHSQTEMDRHRQVEEVSRARREAQEALREAEAEFKQQLAAAQRRAEKLERDGAQAAAALERRVEQAELDGTATKLLLTETQARCEDLQQKLAEAGQGHDAELQQRDQQLREAESRLIDVAALQNNASSKTKSLSTQLLAAEARVASLTDELAATRSQKVSSADALSDARKHSSDLSEQLSDALKRVLELEQRLDAAQIEVQNAGAKAAMLDGCLAEATTSLAATEDENRVLSQHKSKHEKLASDAVARAREMEARCVEVSAMLKEKEVVEASLRDLAAELEAKMLKDEAQLADSNERAMNMERELKELRAELRDIQGITQGAGALEAELAEHKGLKEHVSLLAVRIQEKELQNVGLKKRVEELQAARAQDEASVQKAHLRAEEMRRALHTARLRVPELERALDSHRASLEAQTAQLAQTRARADARAADAQGAVEKAAMWEGRHREAVARQSVLQKQLAEALSQQDEMQASNVTAVRDVAVESTRVAELEALLESTREALRQEGRGTSRLEGQLSEMSAQVVQLEEQLRVANKSREDGQLKLLEARAEYGVLESRLMDARSTEKKYMLQLATQDGALEQVRVNRVQLAEVGRELDEKIATLEAKLQNVVQEKGVLGGALIVAESEIAELKATAVRLNEQSAKHLAEYAVQMEEREGRAAAEVTRLESLWTKSLTDMSSLRLKLEETSIEKHSLVGELEAVKQGASSLTAVRQCAEEERDKAIAEVHLLTTKLNAITNEIANIEQRASDALSSRGEMEGVVASLKKDLATSQGNARTAAASLVDYRIQSASEKAQLENHITVLAAGLSDLEHQLQLAAARTSGLEEAMRGTEQDCAEAVRVQSTSPPPAQPS